MSSLQGFKIFSKIHLLLFRPSLTWMIIFRLRRNRLLKEKNGRLTELRRSGINDLQHLHNQIGQ